MNKNIQGDFQISISVPLSKFEGYILLLPGSHLEPIRKSTMEFFAKMLSAKSI